MEYFENVQWTFCLMCGPLQMCLQDSQILVKTGQVVLTAFTTTLDNFSSQRSRVSFPVLAAGAMATVVHMPNGDSLKFLKRTRQGTLDVPLKWPKAGNISLM